MNVRVFYYWHAILYLYFVTVILRYQLSYYVTLYTDWKMCMNPEGQWTDTSTIRWKHTKCCLAKFNAILNDCIGERRQWMLLILSHSQWSFMPLYLVGNASVCDMMTSLVCLVLTLGESWSYYVVSHVEHSWKPKRCNTQWYKWYRFIWS